MLGVSDCYNNRAENTICFGQKVFKSIHSKFKCCLGFEVADKMLSVLRFDFLSGRIEISIGFEAFLGLSVSIFNNDFIIVFKMRSVVESCRQKPSKHNRRNCYLRPHKKKFVNQVLSNHFAFIIEKRALWERSETPIYYGGWNNPGKLACACSGRLHFLYKIRGNDRISGCVN